jgi:hypothetical protein
MGSLEHRKYLGLEAAIELTDSAFVSKVSDLPPQPVRLSPE